MNLFNGHFKKVSAGKEKANSHDTDFRHVCIGFSLA